MRPALRILAVVALFLGGAAVFLRGERNEFVSYDDPIYVTDNPELELGLSADGIRWSLTAYRGGNWHPVTWWTHLWDYERYGLDAPGGHHRTSALIHAATAALLVWALVALGAAFWPSFWVAALFAVHPLRVESVTWVSERKDVVAAFFWVTTVLAYGLWVRRPSLGRYVVLLLSFALCLASKSMGVTLPFVLLLFDVWPARRLASTTWRRLVVEKLPLLALSAATSVATYFAQATSGSVGTTRGFPLDERVANAALSWVAYPRQMAWPVDLACFYPHPAIVDEGFSLARPDVLGAFALLLAVTALAWWRRRELPYVLVGWLLYLGTLVPAIGLVQVGIQGRADRYTYLPSIGVTIAVVFALAEVARGSRARTVVVNAGGVAVLALAARATLAQIETWRDSEALYRHAIDVTEANYVALNNLGLLLEERGEVAEAERLYHRALEHHPGFPDALANVAKLLIERDEIARARELLERALETNPRHVASLSNLGVIHMGAHADGKARACFEQAVEIDPRHIGSLHNLALLYERADHPAAALPWAERALEIAPDDPDLHRLHGEALAGRERYEEARVALERAVSLGDDGSRVRRELAEVSLALGEEERAIRELEEALAVEPDAVPTLVQLVDLHVEREDDAEAVRLLRRLVALAPDAPRYRSRLAWLLAASPDEDLRDADEALEHAQRAVELTEERDVESLTALAAALMAQEKYRRAARWQRKAIEIAPAHQRPKLEENLSKIEAASQVYRPKPYRDRLR